MRVNIMSALAILLILNRVNAIFDASLAGKNGTSLFTTTCNIQTTLDFSLSSGTTASCSGSSCTLVSASSSSFSFLDLNGNELQLSLTDFAFSTDTVVTGYNTSIISGSFIFKFMSTQGNLVYILVPTTTSSSCSGTLACVDLTSPLAPSNSIKGFGTYPITLSAFNLLNSNNNNLFYFAATADKNANVIASTLIYKIPSSSYINPIAGSTLATQVNALSLAIPTTGDKLCYASHAGAGVFQTHLRESYPLWFCLLSLLLYWIYYLTSEPNLISCYDRKNFENKLTCWSLYSIINLAHEEYFTKLSRLTVVLINWTIQGVFLASIYGNLQTLGPAMIIWTAVIALAATLIFPYLYGAIFLRKIYDKTLYKYEVMKKMLGVFQKESKDSMKEFENEIDETDQKIFGYTYWFGIVSFIIFGICWTISVNQMQKVTRQYYQCHYYWIASMFITFALDHLLLNPVLAALLGNFEWYRSINPYYYDFRLGEAYKQIQN